MQRRQINRKLSTWYIVLCGITISLSSHLVSADLRLLEDLNEVQYSLADAIQDICPRLGGETSLDENATQLFWACSAMVHTSNDIQGVGPSDFSLGVTSSELRNLLAQVAHEETTTNGDAFTEISQSQFASIASRLRSLRRGGSRSVTRFRLRDNSTTFSRGWLSNARETDNSLSSFGSPLSYYINGNFNHGDKEETSRENGFNFATSGITLGADYRVGQSIFVGTAVDLSELDLDLAFDDISSGTNISSLNLNFYSSYFVGHTYLNAMVGFGNNDIKNVRAVPSISGIAIDNLSITSTESITGNTDANVVSVSLSGGHEDSFKSYSLSHYLQLDASRVYISEYSEQGNSPLLLHVNNETINSSAFTLGTQITHASSFQLGVITEVVRLEWKHQFESEQREIDAYYVYDPFEEKTTFTAPSDKPDQDFFSLGLGLTGVLPYGFQLFAYYENIFDLAYYTNQSITVGIRMDHL